MEAEFARDVLTRLPLAEAVLSIWRWVADPLFLLSVFARHGGAGYEKEISFGVLVQLIADALLEHQGSGRKSFERGREQGLLTASAQAVYQKLGRVSLGLSEAWLAESTARVRPIYPSAAGVPLPSSLQGLEVIVVDGKAIKRVAKRLKPLQGRKGGVLGGKALVALELRSGLAVAMATHPDGETNDAKLVPALLPQVREYVAGGRLWVADRQFCDLTQTAAFALGISFAVFAWECHGNVVSSKIVDCTVNYFLLEDIVVAAFIVSSFGTFVMGLVTDLFTVPSGQTFALLAYGWTVAGGERQTITTYLWLTGATTVKHFSRFYIFLGGPLYEARWQLWGRLIRRAAQWVPAEAPIVLIVDDSTKKKAGRHIEGVGHYRNGAGSARQEYRTLRGLNFVWGIMRVPVPRWPGHRVSVPIGLSLYLKEEQARKLKRPYRSRSALARELVDWVAAQLPERPIRVLGDGGYATKEYLHQLPPTVDVVSRMLITGKLYARPPQSATPRRGCPPKKGPVLGSPKTLARKRGGWQPHPSEAGALVHVWEGLWHAVLPGRLIRVVVVRRPATNRPRHPGHRKSPPPVEAFFTTDLALNLEALLAQYRERWAVEITLRDSNAFTGLGQDQCRKVERIVGANTFRLILAAARTLWFVASTQHTTPLPLGRYRPWYRQKVTPSQLDIVWTWREALPHAGVFPIPRFTPGLIQNPEEPAIALPLAA